MNNLSTIAIIFNPTKDINKVKLYVKLAQEKRKDINFVIIHTDNFEDIENKAHMAISKGCDICIAAGGDGTVLGVMNAAIKHNTPFSVLPLGTGNDFSKSISIFNIEDAVNTLINGKIINLDAGICEYQKYNNEKSEMYFCSTGGVGAIARVLSYEKYLITKILKKILKNNVWPLLTIVSLIFSKNLKTEVVLNQNEIEGQIKLFEISKVQVAGDMYFTPLAETANGILDAWMLHDIGFVKTLQVFLEAEKPDLNHFSHPGVEYFSSIGKYNQYGYSNLTEISIYPDKTMPLHLHGDMLGYTPCHFKILPKKIKVLA